MKALIKAGLNSRPSSLPLSLPLPVLLGALPVASALTVAPVAPAISANAVNPSETAALTPTLVPSPSSTSTPSPSSSSTTAVLSVDEPGDTQPCKIEITTTPLDETTLAAAAAAVGRSDAPLLAPELIAVTSGDCPDAVLSVTL